jgi:PAS domain S-box-containing protein
MTRDKKPPAEIIDLRRRAEKLLIGNTLSILPPRTDEELQRFHHELEVHHLELEMQYVELRQARDDVDTMLGKYSDLYDFSPVGYFTLDRKGSINNVNITGACLLGVERYRLLGRRFVLFVNEDARSAFTAFLENVFTSPSKDTYELELLKEGYFPLHVQIEAVAASSGQECHFALIDITGRKQAEDALKESEVRLRLLIDGAKDYAIFMLDVDGHVTSWNEGAKRLKGWDVHEILGQHFSLFYTEEAVAAGHPGHELNIAATNGRYEEEGWRVRKDGSKFLANVIITAIRGESGMLRGFSKITRDITERKQAELEAEAANKAKSQFLANMSHELRTPMTGILGMLQLALEEELSPTLRDYLETSITSARSLLNVLNDILIMAKIEAGKLIIEEKPFSLQRCIADAVHIFTPEVRRKGLASPSLWRRRRQKRLLEMKHGCARYS